MFPTIYKQQTPFGELPYNTWGLMITLAFVASAILGHRRSPKVGIDPDKMVGMYVVAIVFGLAGARLMHFLMATPEVFWRDPTIFFRIWEGGFAFYGGFILAGIAGIFYCRAREIDPWKMADLVAPLVMLGLAFGRIGCFSAGCCHGMAIALPPDATPLLDADFKGGQVWFIPRFPFLIEMTRHGVGHNDVTVYPTQIFEMLAAFAIFGFGSWLWRHRRFDGQVMAAVLVLYSIWRPINESLRGDEVRGMGYFGFLTSSQLISIPVFVLGVVIALVQFRKGVAPEVEFQPDTSDAALGAAPRL